MGNASHACCGIDEHTSESSEATATNYQRLPKPLPFVPLKPARRKPRVGAFQGLSQTYYSARTKTKIQTIEFSESCVVLEFKEHEPSKPSFCWQEESSFSFYHGDGSERMQSPRSDFTFDIRK